jgi:hypothetical protein
MIRSEGRAHAAANEPVSAMGAGAPDDQATKEAAASPPLGNRPKLAPGRPRPPWLVRNSRKATIALVITILAASPFAYLYIQRNFGPDPLAGIKIDGVKFDPVFDVVNPAEVRPVVVKPAMAKPIAAAKPAELAPKPVPPPLSASPAAPFAAAPAAPSVGVTHTRSATAAARPDAAPPVSAILGAREVTIQPRSSAREPQAVSTACAEAVAALGLCDPNTKAKDK